MALMQSSLALIGANFAALRSRLWASLVAVIGIAGPAGMFLCVWGLITSFSHSVSNTARPDRVVVLSQGVTDEAGSDLSRAAVRNLIDMPHWARDSSGAAIVSIEGNSPVRLSKRKTSLDAFVTLRGISENGRFARPEITVIDGRWFRPGTYELIAGQSVQREVKGLEIGDRVPFGDTSWVVVGTFTSHRDIHESELIGDTEAMLSAAKWHSYSSVFGVLNPRSSIGDVRKLAASNPSLNVNVYTEPEYLTLVSSEMQGTLRLVAWTIGTIVGLGAMVTMMNTMYGAVAARRIEIATLRAIGFSPVSVLLTVITEALLLALIGGLLGMLVASSLFQGVALTSTVGDTEMDFAMRFDSSAVLACVLFSCCAALLGAVVPAARAVRTPVARALRTS